MIRETFSSKETFEFAKSLAAKAEKGDIYTLIGNLGVGKTVFTQGFAEGLGIEGPVNSPTFTILQVYDKGRLPFYHFDVYRIGDVEEMDEIGYEDCFFGDGVCMIEWADLVKEIIPKSAVRITIDKDLSRGTDYRLIQIHGDGYEDTLN